MHQIGFRAFKSSCNNIGVRIELTFFSLTVRSIATSSFRCTVESRLYVRVGTQKFGRRTERDEQVKIIFRITPCKVFWMSL